MLSTGPTGWIRSVRYSPNGLFIACGMGGETDGMFPGGSGTKRHTPREEDGTIKIVSGGLRPEASKLVPYLHNNRVMQVL